MACGTILDLTGDAWDAATDKALLPESLRE